MFPACLGSPLVVARNSSYCNVLDYLSLQNSRSLQIVGLEESGGEGGGSGDRDGEYM